MRCKKCKQAGSPIHSLLEKLSAMEGVEVLSACAGYHFDGHYNVPEHPYIHLYIKQQRILELLWQQVFSKLTVPSYFVYNGNYQHIFEIELPLNWPKRDELVSDLWKLLIGRMENVK